MEHHNFEWRSILSELNDFSCKVEFLQCETRRHVILKKNLDIGEYLIFLKNIMMKHELNLDKILRKDQYSNNLVSKRDRKLGISMKIFQSNETLS